MGNSRFKQTKNINRDIFEGFSEILAQQRMDELAWFTGVLTPQEETAMISFLRDRIEAHYRATDTKWKNAEAVRDYMICFTRH